MSNRLVAWWRWGIDPRQTLPPDVTARLERLAIQWRAALDAMRAVPEHRQATTRPWYLVLGPAGAGKSTLLSHSGMALDPIINTDGETADVTLWLGAQAVFIEVAGHLFDHDDRQYDWRALVWLITRACGPLPIRGVLLIRPLAEQFRRTPAETAADATRIRDRLQVLADLTGAVVPTSVVISKADLLGGFKEFFASSDAREREQVLGATLSWPPERDPVHAVTVAYEKLLDNLRDRRLAALAAAASEADRRKLMQFPAQLRAALPYLTDHLAIAVRPRTDGEPTLRGVYFTSILPPARRQPTTGSAHEREPEDPKSLFFNVAAAAAPAMQAPATPATAVPVPAPDLRHVSFVHALFARVLLPDAGLAHLTPSARRRRHQVRIACVAVIPAFLALLLLWSCWSTWRGIGLIEGLRAPLAALDEDQRSNTNDTTARLLAIDRLGTALHTALEHHGADLGPAGRSAAARYVQAVRPLLIDTCLRSVRDELAALRHPGAGQTATADGSADLLRTYQMIGGMLPAQPDLVMRTLLNERRWFRAVDPPGGGTCEFRVEALARQQLDLCLTVLLPARLLTLDIDRPLVEALHRELGDRLLIDQAYEDLVRDLSPRFAAIPRETLLPDTKSGDLEADLAISRLYTQEAWNDTVALAIGQRTERLLTALAESGLPHDRATVASRLRQRFVDDHQRRWLAVIASMHAMPVRDLRDTTAQLDRLCGENSPLPRFLTGALAHVNLDVSDAATRGRTGSDWIGPCLRAIGTLRSDLIDYQQASALARRATDDDRLRSLLARFNAVSTRIGDLLIQVEQPATRAAIRSGFDGLLRSLIADLVRNHVDDLDRLWSEQVFQTFDAHLAKRFPFTRAAGEEVPMPEFAAFFAPDGLLWSALTRIETMRDITLLGQPVVTLHQDYPRVLRNAQDLRALFFAGSSPTVNLRFSYRMQQREHVRDLRVQFGATANTLYERPDARHQAGIVQGGPHAARISLQTVEGEWKHREAGGDWGFLRLLHLGRPQTVTGGELLCTWEHDALIGGKTQTVKASLVLESGNMTAAVAGDLLSGLTLPRRVLVPDAAR